jgi:hypothetical protein
MKAGKPGKVATDIAGKVKVMKAKKINRNAIE